MASRVSSASSEESFWNGQKENLKKIREILTQNPHNRSSPVSNVYRKSRPSFLPKFGRSPYSPTLRGSRYNIVPPVKLKFPNTRNDGYDSWGDDNGDSEPEEPLLPSHQYSTVHLPAHLAVPPNEQRQPPLKGVLQSSRNRPNENLPKKKVTYQSTPIYLIRESSKNSQEQKLNKLHLNEVSKSSKSDPFDPTSNPILARYLPNSYSNVLTGDSKTKHFEEYLAHDPTFLSRYVDQLMEEFLEEELVPDLLIEFYHSEESRTTPELKYIRTYDPAKLKSPVKAPRRVLPHEDADHLKDFLNALVSEVINEECQLIARAAGREMATSLLETMAIYDIIMDMVTEEMLQTGDFIVDEALQELMLEDLLAELLIEPEVGKQSKEVAMETMKQYSNRRRQKEIQQIDKSVGQRIQEELCLDYLLKLTTRQGQLWTKEQYADRILDDMVLSILLHQFHDVKRRRKATMDNIPLRQLHEKLITDTALDCLLGELSRHLDEDIADLDQYEQGMQHNVYNWLASEEATPI